MKLYSLRITEKENNDIEELSKEIGVTKNSLVMIAIFIYIQKFLKTHLIENWYKSF